MTRRDPTEPLYSNRVSCVKEKIKDTIENVWKFVRMNNPRAMFGLSQSDIEIAIEGLLPHMVIGNEPASLEILETALRDLRKTAGERSIDFGDFSRLVAMHKRIYDTERMQKDIKKIEDAFNAKDSYAHLNTDRHKERVKNAPKANSRAIKEYWVAHIKEDLRASGVNPKSFGLNWL